MLGNKYVAIAVGILLVIVMAYNANKFFFSKENQPETPVAQIAANSKPLEHDPGTMPERIPEKEDKGQWKRDPFNLEREIQHVAEDQEPEKPPLDIRLMGIIKRDGRSHALINGKVYRVHDEFDDAIIKEIKKHSIVLLSEGETREISFDDYVVLKEKAK
jgi:hypothetical protein